MILQAKNILLFIALMVPMTMMAQMSTIKYRNRLSDSTVLVNTAVDPPKVKGPKQLTKEFSVGLRLNTDGYGIFIDKGWLRGGDDFGTINRDKLFHENILQIELLERKHPKEITTSSLPAVSALSSSYILGKINKFYAFKIGFGRRQLIAGKPDPGTFSIHWLYLGGLSAGLIKPYYLKLYSPGGDIKYADSLAAEFTSPNNISGRSSFFKGINELKIVPGLHAKTGLHIDFASSRKSVMALEVGVNAEYYTQRIEQMVGIKPNNLFFAFYGALQFGWLK